MKENEVCPVADAVQVIKQPCQQQSICLDQRTKGKRNTGAYVVPHHFIKRLLHFYPQYLIILETNFPLFEMEVRTGV